MKAPYIIAYIIVGVVLIAAGTACFFNSAIFNGIGALIIGMGIGCILLGFFNGD